MKTYLHSERRKFRESGETTHGAFRGLSTPTKRKKREREQFYAALQQSESFVVKLFDRSLDLSKYTEKTPLYPICRAWIANQPRNPNLFTSKEQADRETRERRQNNGAEFLRKIQKGESIIVNSMPAPLNIEVSKTIDAEEISPNLEALDKALEIEKDDEEESVTNRKNELLAQHKQKWKTVKRKWAAKVNAQDKRYELNQLIIKKLYRN